MTVNVESKLPRAFIWRRLHSLMGLWLVLFLMEHLLVNSQAALFLGDSGKGFVEMVNSIHNLPYLPVIEFVLLGVPIFIHLVWGVKYLLTSKCNTRKTDGSTPSLPEYSRNRAFTWQLITSWVLLVGLIGHIVKFRFLDYPDALHYGTATHYFIPLKVDNGLYTVAERLKVSLYDAEAIAKEKSRFENRKDEKALLEARDALAKKEMVWPESFWEGPLPSSYNSQKAVIFTAAQKFEEKARFLVQLEKYKLSKHEILAVCEDFGTASLLSVRDTFKNPIYVILYTLFVLAACFHAFNGLWTFLITWGIVLRMSAQKKTVTFAVGLMLIITFLGLSSIWGTYWLNLKS